MCMKKNVNPLVTVIQFSLLFLGFFIYIILWIIIVDSSDVDQKFLHNGDGQLVHFITIHKWHSQSK